MNHPNDVSQPAEGRHQTARNRASRPGKPECHARPWAPHRQRRLDFKAINRAALPRLPELCKRWLPDGRREGVEWVARNPTRTDRKPGSFKVNLMTGIWADFATDDKGGDVISLAAYIFGLTQLQAAGKLAEMLGMAP